MNTRTAASLKEVSNKLGEGFLLLSIIAFKEEEYQKAKEHIYEAEAHFRKGASIPQDLVLYQIVYEYYTLSEKTKSALIQFKEQINRYHSETQLVVSPSPQDNLLNFESPKNILSRHQIDPSLLAQSIDQQLNYDLKIYVLKANIKKSLDEGRYSECSALLNEFSERHRTILLSNVSAYNEIHDLIMQAFNRAISEKRYSEGHTLLKNFQILLAISTQQAAQKFHTQYQNLHASIRNDLNTYHQDNDLSQFVNIVLEIENQSELFDSLRSETLTHLIEMGKIQNERSLLNDFFQTQESVVNLICHNLKEITDKDELNSLLPELRDYLFLFHNYYLGKETSKDKELRKKIGGMLFSLANAIKDGAEAYPALNPDNHVLLSLAYFILREGEEYSPSPALGFNESLSIAAKHLDLYCDASGLVGDAKAHAEQLKNLFDKNPINLFIKLSQIKQTMLKLPSLESLQDKKSALEKLIQLKLAVSDLPLESRKHVPSLEWFKSELANVCNDLGEVEKAKEISLGILETNPNHAASIKLICVILEKQIKDYQEDSVDNNAMRKVLEAQISRYKMMERPRTYLIKTFDDVIFNRNHECYDQIIAVSPALFRQFYQYLLNEQKSMLDSLPKTIISHIADEHYQNLKTIFETLSKEQKEELIYICNLAANKGSDTAKLKLASIHMRLQEFKKAEIILINLTADLDNNAVSKRIKIKSNFKLADLYRQINNISSALNTLERCEAIFELDAYQNQEEANIDRTYLSKQLSEIRYIQNIIDRTPITPLANRDNNTKGVVYFDFDNTLMKSQDLPNTYNWINKHGTDDQKTMNKTHAGYLKGSNRDKLQAYTYFSRFYTDNANGKIWEDIFKELKSKNLILGICTARRWDLHFNKTRCPLFATFMHQYGAFFDPSHIIFTQGQDKYDELNKKRSVSLISRSSTLLVDDTKRQLDTTYYAGVKVLSAAELARASDSEAFNRFKEELFKVVQTLPAHNEASKLESPIENQAKNIESNASPILSSQITITPPEKHHSFWQSPQRVSQRSSQRSKRPSMHLIPEEKTEPFQKRGRFP